MRVKSVRCCAKSGQRCTVSFRKLCRTKRYINANFRPEAMHKRTNYFLFDILVQLVLSHHYFFIIEKLF